MGKYQVEINQVNEELEKEITTSILNTESVKELMADDPEPDELD